MTSEVTVVIPAWGPVYVRKYLPDAIGSVRRQQDAEVRVLIVDNASTVPVQSDADAVDVMRLADRVSLGQARNAGLRSVDTRHVLFLDADDRLLQGSLARMIDLARRNADAVLVSASLLHPDTGRPYHWPYPWMKRVTAWPTAFAVLETIRPSFPVNGSLIRTDAALNSGGFDSSSTAAEDWTLGVSLAWRGRVVVPRLPTMTYQPNPKGLWATNRTLHDHLRHRAAIRARVRRDPCVPLAVRVALPAISAVQTVDALRKVARDRLTGE